MTLVIDASIALASIFPDEKSAVADVIMDRVVSEGAIVPSLWRLEVANVLRSATRRKRCNEKFEIQSLERLARLPVLIDTETDDHAWGRTRELALKHDLSIYDAAYLELALRRGGDLATFDQALAEAARAAGAVVIG